MSNVPAPYLTDESILFPAVMAGVGVEGAQLPAIEAMQVAHSCSSGSETNSKGSHLMEQHRETWSDTQSNQQLSSIIFGNKFQFRTAR